MCEKPAHGLYPQSRVTDDSPRMAQELPHYSLLTAQCESLLAIFGSFTDNLYVMFLNAFCIGQLVWNSMKQMDCTLGPLCLSALTILFHHCHVCHCCFLWDLWHGHPYSLYSCTWGLHQAFCYLLPPYSMAVNRIWSHLQEGLSARACEQHFSLSPHMSENILLRKFFSSLKILYTLLHFYLVWKSLWKHLGPVDINRKMGKTEKRHFIKEIQMSNKHMKRYSSLISNQRYANLKQK